MANDFSGRIWKITNAGTTPNGAWNVKIAGGIWSDDVAGATFTMTDIAGRVYTWTIPVDGDTVNFQRLGWLSGPITFGGTFTKEVNLYLDTK